MPREGQVRGGVSLQRDGDSVGRCLGQRSLREGCPALLLRAAASSFEKATGRTGSPLTAGGVLLNSCLPNTYLGARLTELNSCPCCRGMRHLMRESDV